MWRGSQNSVLRTPFHNWQKGLMAYRIFSGKAKDKLSESKLDEIEK